VLGYVCRIASTAKAVCVGRINMPAALALWLLLVRRHLSCPGNWRSGTGMQ
jgi:hypothetical protein